MYNQQNSTLGYKTSCISEEKYKVARLIQASYTFSVVSILDGCSQPCMYDGMYAVVGQLLDKGLIEDTGQYDISNDDQMVKIYRVVHKLDENGTYQVDLERQSAFEGYIEQLDRSRTQPDSQGKPRNLNFRVAEETLNELRNLLVGQTSESRESLLLSFYRHLSLAQLEEITEGNAHQNAIGEAYIRQLYAEYLIAQDTQQWSSAIAQLIKAAHLFREKGLNNLQRVCESRACEILTTQYTLLCKSSFNYCVSKFLDFARAMDALVKAVNDKFCSVNFQFIYRRILDEISHKIDFLSRSTGELNQVTSQGWTVSDRSETPAVSDIYELLNQARLLLMNSGRSQDRKIDAKEHLEEAQFLLESRWQDIDSEEALILRSLLESHLQALNISLNISELNKLELKHKIANLNSLDLEGCLPFYWVDTLKQLISIVSEAAPRLDFAPNVEEEFVENFSNPLGLSISEPELKDVGYTSTDFDNLRRAVKDESSYRWNFEQGQWRNGQYSNQILERGTHSMPIMPGRSEKNPEIEKNAFVSRAADYQLNSTIQSPLLSEELLEMRKSKKNYGTVDDSGRTPSRFLVQNFANEFDLRLLNLPPAKQVLLSK